MAGDRQLRPGRAGDDPPLGADADRVAGITARPAAVPAFFEQQSVDVAIIDVAWNGILELMKIASMADAYEVNVAPHNFNGHIGSLMSAHMCAAIPNFRVMEIDIEDVPWKDDLVTPVPVIENGELVLPTGPGWGVEVNEEVIRAHPPQPMGRWER